VLWRRHDLPLVAGALEAEAGALVGRAELGQGVLDRARGTARDPPKLVPRHGLLGDEEDRFDRVG
jgi:hypothetical protein